MDHSVPSEVVPAAASFAPGAAPPDSSSLSRSTVLAMRRLLHAFRDGWIVDSLAVSAAQMVTDDAHRNGLRPEQMLVCLKDQWADLAEVRQLSGAVDRQHLLSQLITLAIEAYYATSHPVRDTG
jgi:hypothetical protein